MSPTAPVISVSGRTLPCLMAAEAHSRWLALNPASPLGAPQPRLLDALRRTVSLGFSTSPLLTFEPFDQTAQFNRILVVRSESSGFASRDVSQQAQGAAAITKTCPRHGQMEIARAAFRMPRCREGVLRGHSPLQ